MSNIEYLSPINLPKLEITHTPQDSGEFWENLTTGDLMYFDGTTIHNITASISGGDHSVDGGVPDSIYLPNQNLDGGEE